MPRVRALLAAAALIPVLAAPRPAAAQPAAAQGTVQYVPLDGTVYRALPDTGPVARAQRALEAAPRDIDRFIALGIAQAGARQFREAIATFTRALEVAPTDARLYRWRGHRHLSVREFARARADLERGLALDAANYGILFHLGILDYLDGRYDEAAALFARAQPLAPDGGERAGSTDWRWLSLARAGRLAEARAMLDARPDSLPAPPGYAYVSRLALYRGQRTPASLITPADTADVQRATLAYGLGAWRLVHGDTAGALDAFDQAIASGGWAGFGFIAAEGERARLRGWRLRHAGRDGGRHRAADSAALHYAPTPENLAARRWYQDAKLGMFIHWGVSSLLQDGEWVMNNRGLRVAEYETLAPLFTAAGFDAGRWARAARGAGMRYITLVAKHHDGIALWDSPASDWTVPRRTPFGRDVVRELAEACAREGLRFFVYYSQLDWHHPDYFPRGQTGKGAGRPEAGVFPRYLDFMDAQLTELLTRYGPIGGVWFDGVWDQPGADWRLERTYALIHRLQPAALIIPNNHEPPRPGEDIQTFERDLPGANTMGFNTGTIGQLPLEMSETMNESWGFRLQDRAWKSPAQLIRGLVAAAGRDANFLLNVGPRPDGTFPAEAEARLAALGDWLRTNGAAVYGTRGGPVPPRPWGVTTQKGDTVYVHLLEGPDAAVTLPPLGRPVARAFLLDGGAPVAVQAGAAGVTLTLPRRDLATPVQVVAVVLQARAR